MCIYIYVYLCLYNIYISIYTRFFVDLICRGNDYIYTYSDMNIMEDFLHSESKSDLVHSI